MVSGDNRVVYQQQHLSIKHIYTQYTLIQSAVQYDLRVDKKNAQ